jgi:DNA-binding NarL/FixJ family response regulator
MLLMQNFRILVTNGLASQQKVNRAEEYETIRRDSGATRSNPIRLTVREIQVLKFVVEGLNNRQIASEVNVSIKTVEKHRQSLMNKLDLHYTAGLARYAVGQGIIFDEGFRLALARRLQAHPGRGRPKQSLPRPITARETQVLKLIADGLVSKQIASELNISIKTVDNHRQDLMERLDIHEVAGLTRYAIAKGLVPAMIRPPSPCQASPGLTELRTLQPPGRAPQSIPALCAC